MVTSRQNVGAMSVAQVQRFTALLALVAGGGALALLIAGLVPAPASRRALAAVHDLALWLAWLVAAVATVGSLYFSERAHFTPCRLCWYQRIAMYPLAVILLVAAVRRDHGVRWYAVPVAVVGMAISTYHYLIEWHPEWEATSCDITAPCSVPWFREFGFVSLSFMALCGFAAIIALLMIPTPIEEHADHG
jgi:disulfide bond formation protein DsbB